MKLTRRPIVKTTALTCGTVAMPQISRGRVLGPNEELRIGVIGIGIRGAGSLGPSLLLIPDLYE